VPLIGLVYLAADGLAPRALAWWRRSRALAAGAAGLAILVVLGNGLLALPIMTHEVRIDRMQRLIARLDRLHPDRNYAILTPYTYSDFSYLRFVYPDRPVYTVQSEFNRSSSNWEYYSERVIRDIAGLKALEVETLIYLGFHENPAVENLRRLVDWIRLPILRAALEQKRFQDHLTLSWMWTDPGLVFGEPLAEGHYRAYPVRIR
jgi:hypothetical protein